MEIHSQPLASAAEIKALATELKKHSIIAFDTEFIRETTFFPIVEIIQVATTQDSWLVDAQAFKRNYRQGPEGSFDAGLKPLLEIFEDPAILKVAHAVQGDQECLFTSFGAVATPVFDTAIGASLCGLGEGIGLSKLLKAVMEVDIAKGHARTNWSVRPLPEELLAYAHADVQYLVEMAQKLLAELEKLGRKQWALEHSEKWSDKAMYSADIEAMAVKLARSRRLDKRAFASLIELVRWRENRVRHLNLPRRWVADDNVLLDLASVRPKTMEHLSSFRGLNKGELKNSGQTILDAIQAASAHADIKPPHIPKPDIPTVEESQVLDLLKCFVGILADRHKIAAKYLLTSAQLLPLLKRETNNPEELVAFGVLTPEAATLIGGEIIAFLHGKRALAVNGKQIDIVEKN